MYRFEFSMVSFALLQKTGSARLGMRKQQLNQRRTESLRNYS